MNYGVVNDVCCHVVNNNIILSSTFSTKLSLFYLGCISKRLWFSVVKHL